MVFTLPAQAAWMGQQLKQEEAMSSTLVDQVYITMVLRILAIYLKR
jgi:hypothetical protein